MSSAQNTTAMTFIRGWFKTQHIFTWSQNITLHCQLAASSIWLTSYLSSDKWSTQHGESLSVYGMESRIHKINKDIIWNIHTIWTIPKNGDSVLTLTYAYFRMQFCRSFNFCWFLAFLLVFLLQLCFEYWVLNRLDWLLWWHMQDDGFFIRRVVKLDSSRLRINWRGTIEFFE